ncbi:MAG: hypothetical protein M3N42_07775 [Cyanobacteriota bacterium]|nr:hypothetical protein [Cyanobacteriota bacterium]
MPAADAPTRDSRRSNTEAAGVRLHPQSRVRLKGFSYRETEKLLKVSKSFIAQTHRKYLGGGIVGLKLKYQGSKSYLTKEYLSATIQ